MCLMPWHYVTHLRVCVWTSREFTLQSFALNWNSVCVFLCVSSIKSVEFGLLARKVMPSNKFRLAVTTNEFRIRIMLRFNALSQPCKCWVVFLLARHYFAMHTTIWRTNKRYSDKPPRYMHIVRKQTNIQITLLPHYHTTWDYIDTHEG